MSAKQILRKEVALVLSRIPKQEIENQSKKITESLAPLLQTCRNIACYVSMDVGEVDTEYLLRNLFDEGKIVYLPRCTTTKETGHVILREKGKHHPHLTFHRIKSWQQVQEMKPLGKFQLREPPQEHPPPLPAQLDVMLVPGVAFSTGNGGRLGHGCGYYDDFFRRYKLQHHGSKPLLIGLSLKEQVVNSVPVESHDQGMDCIVTGDGGIHWAIPQK